MVKSLLTAITLGGITLTVFLLGVPSLVETQARERLLTAVPRSTLVDGLTVSSASFGSLTIGHLPSALIGAPSFDISINQPTALFSHSSTASDGGSQSFQASASRLSLNLAVDAQGDGTCSLNRVIISPIAQSVAESDLSRASLVDYQSAPVITIDEASAALPSVQESPRQAFTRSLETLTRGINGTGSDTLLIASGQLLVPQFNATIPLSTLKKGTLHHLVLDKISLSAIPLRDPFSAAELSVFEHSPLTASYILLLRNAADTFARRLTREQSTVRDSPAPPPELAIRYAVYGYFLSRVFGATESHKLGEFFCSGRDELPSVDESSRDTLDRSRSRELLNIGFRYAERELVTARDLTRIIARETFQHLNDHNPQQPLRR